MCFHVFVGAACTKGCTKCRDKAEKQTESWIIAWFSRVIMRKRSALGEIALKYVLVETSVPPLLSVTCASEHRAHSQPKLFTSYVIPSSISLLSQQPSSFHLFGTSDQVGEGNIIICMDWLSGSSKADIIWTTERPMGWVWLHPKGVLGPAQQ